MCLSIFCRQRVRDEIARDRAEKEARAAAAKGSSQAVQTTNLAAQSTDTVVTPTIKKEYTTCRLQVYFPSMYLHESHSYKCT